MAKGLPDSKKYIKEKQAPLRFGADGKFRILHLTDIHEVDPEMDDEEDRQIPINKSKETINVIRRCIEIANPDLIVFGGDNVSGYWQEFTYEYMYNTIKKIVAPIAEKNIPLAIVFGNHDAEAQPKLPFLAKENQICIYAEYENFRSTMNDEDVSGCANCSLPILSSDGKHIAWNIWCIDSGDYVRDDEFNVIDDAGYGFVKKDQIAWYERRAAELKAQNGGKAVPSLLFQHIPVIQEYKKTQKRPGWRIQPRRAALLRPGRRTARGRDSRIPMPAARKRRRIRELEENGRYSRRILRPRPCEHIHNGSRRHKARSEPRRGLPLLRRQTRRQTDYNRRKQAGFV